ncbi:unnamed protein product [Medioppia subpectinata]|uniref:Lipase maturation factor n=1 Tax=Medioppia subpectinata TaxID=1979941 RepID=A0A7R9Q3N9_9ACAR|nr:unnamed protein product [Medioppia subpectinata]CAG2111519.1 unnamed protein product [Medioppia subpectinata]
MSGSNVCGINRVHNYYLWAVSGIYLFAFTSIYTQIPGLYGDDGVLPVRAFAQMDKRGASAIVEAFKRVPSLVWLGPSIGLSFASTLEIVALSGIVISFLGLITKRFRDFWSYSLLFVLYFSIYQVGQTFMWFQWDTLLLETGLLTALTAPLNLPLLVESGPHTGLTFWLVRWLLFRLMFASGVVKLTSGCPKWWTLTALDIHFESQCIPTPFAWFVHHFPSSLLRLSVVMTYVIEIAVPFLFFIPIKNLRIFAFVMQVIFQLAIILTGNYNFFNLLTTVLCLSILNDSHVKTTVVSANTGANSGLKRRFLMPKLIRKVITGFAYFGLMYWTIHLFNINWSSGGLSTSVGFDNNQLNQFILWALPVSISLATLSLVSNVLMAFSRCLILPTSGLTRVVNLFYTTLYTSAVVFMFCVSLVPHVSVDPTHSVRLWPVINRWHKSVDRFPVANSYGLFRHMTGLNGRPELVIEGSNDMASAGGWKAYHFLHKPGDMTKAPKFIVPHQPRLDWQMWFAALDSYQNNPWLMNLCYRLLTAQPEVLDLLDKSQLPFKKAPKFVRIRLFTYRYTGKNAKNWWRREDEREYVPPVSIESLAKYIKANGIETSPTIDLSDKHPFVTKTLSSVRRLCTQLPANSFIYSLFSAALLIANF